MLDEFSATKLENKSEAPKAPNSKPTAAATAAQPSDEGDDFARQLQAGMADLLGQLGSDPQMQKELESMMQNLASAEPNDLTDPAAATRPKSAGGSAASKKAGEDAFQDTIRKTMERMQNSGESASAAAANSSEEDFLAQMLKEMGNGGNDEDLNKMLMGMMEQLTNKDILYEPMKDLNDKFPEWMEKNKDKTNPADLEKYKEQQGLVAEIVARFERKGYSDENKEDRDFIVEKMQKV